MANPSFIAKAEQILQQLATLNIVTAVGDAQIQTVQTEAGERRKVVVPEKNKAIYTSINLLDGEITTVIPADYLGADSKDLRDFHQAREAQGMSIIKQNLETLRELVKFVDEAYESAKKRGGDPKALADKSGPAKADPSRAVAS